MGRPQHYLSDQYVEIFLRLYALLYTDDTTGMEESPSRAKCSYSVDIHCEDWKLTVNTDKTKIVIFSRGKVRQQHTFMFRKDKLLWTPLCT